MFDIQILGLLSSRINIKEASVENMKKLMTTDDGQRMITIAHLSRN